VGRETGAHKGEVNILRFECARGILVHRPVGRETGAHKGEVNILRFECARGIVEFVVTFFIIMYTCTIWLRNKYPHVALIYILLKGE